MTKYSVQVTLKTGEKMEQEMVANTYEDICLQVKAAAFDPENIQSITTKEIN